jgi:hypothetical protein
MYTVIRFSDTSGKNDLPRLGDELNRHVPRLYDGLDRVPNRFSCSVCSENDWVAHHKAIIDVLSRCADLILNAQEKQITIEIDIAVDPDDHSWRLITQVLLDLDLIGLLSKLRVPVGISIYGSDKTAP